MAVNKKKVKKAKKGSLRSKAKSRSSGDKLRGPEVGPNKDAGSGLSFPPPPPMSNTMPMPNIPYLRSYATIPALRKSEEE
ncbi:MAG: hypothetical protein ACXABY_05445 [Candidatus Thorarchaeota archaeon]|jgi:hypothetical protein